RMRNAPRSWSSWDLPFDESPWEGHSGSVQLRAEPAVVRSREDPDVMPPAISGDDAAEIHPPPPVAAARSISRAHRCADETRRASVFQTGTGFASAGRHCARWYFDFTARTLLP